jgi:hypothetical protein
MNRQHAVVWIDHREAHLFGIGADAGEKLSVVEHSPSPIRHIHHKAGPTASSGHEPESLAFMDEVAKALDGVKEILIAGPAQAKHHLKTRLDQHWPHIAANVVGVEALDHPSETEILNFARRAFHKIDRMRP